VAEILRSAIRHADIAGRIGGDEFVVLATNHHCGTFDAVAARVQQRLAEANASGRWPHRLALSVGAAVFDPAAPASLEELMRLADAALYAEKRRRKAGRLGA
jgi:diguanylate cyclase (GGDEF)-like protein